MSDFKEIDKAAKALEAAKKKREQSQHQVIRQENRLESEEKKQRSKRTHMLWNEVEEIEKNGIAERVDARSYVDRGIDRLPQVHEGPAVRAMEKKGIPTMKSLDK